MVSGIGVGNWLCKENMVIAVFHQNVSNKRPADTRRPLFIDLGFGKFLATCIDILESVMENCWSVKI